MNRPNNLKYQIIKLTRIAYYDAGLPVVSGPYFYQIDPKTFVEKNFNNIHSFMFWVPGSSDPLASRINLVEINSFKISDYEIVGERAPLKMFSVGTSIEHEERYTEINIPNSLKQLNCVLTATTGATNDIYLILRLNNVKEDQHFKNYFRYETQVIELENSPLERIKKFSFRPKAGAKKLVGLHASFINPNHVFFQLPGGIGGSPTYTAYSGVPLLTTNSHVGRLSLQLNNKSSLPFLMDLKDYTFEGVTRKVYFADLDEPILKSSVVDGYFQLSEQVSNSVPNFTMYLTLKYAI